MSNHRVQQAITAVLSLAPAAALHAAQVDITTVPANNVLYISGSTEIDPELTSYYISGATAPCSSAASDPAPSFYVSTVTHQKFVAVACVGNESSSFAGQSIAILKEDNGASQFGIDPVRDDNGLALTGQTVINFFPNYLTMTAANCPGGTCNPSVTTSTVHPNLGFAELDPVAFQDSLGTASQFNTLDVIFAPAVGLGLYHELQTLEGLAAGSDLASNMPKLLKEELASIFNTQVTNWNKIFTTIGSTAVTWGTSGGTGYNGGASSVPSTTTIVICRRGESSGAQRTAEIFFENQNCSAAAMPIRTPTQSSCSTDGCTWSTAFRGSVVFAGAGTGDVLSCLEAEDKLGRLAIGFASIDNPWGSFQSNTARQDFRYIRYNEAVPSIETAATGLATYWAQSVGIAPASTNGNVATGVAAQIASFMESGSNRFGSAASLVNVNATHVYETGNWDAGFLAIPDGVTAIPNASTGVTVAQFEANPVNSTTELASSGVTNNCVPPFQSPTATSSSASPSWLAPPVF